MSRILTGPALLLSLVGLTAGLVGCHQEPPSRWEAADRATQEDAPTVNDGDSAPMNTQALPKTGAEIVPGSEFNRLFPAVESPWDIVFKQEKEGLAQASLQRDGNETATLSISDTENNPAAAEKYASTTEKLDGYPMTSSGSLGTSILVDGRFQVQVRSAAEGGLSSEERAEWVRKFDLTGLEALR